MKLTFPRCCVHIHYAITSHVAETRSLPFILRAPAYIERAQTVYIAVGVR